MELKILLVEDDETTYLIVKSTLGRTYPLTWVKSTELALVELQKTPFSLILLDIELPGENGFNFFAKLKSDDRFRSIPVIFLTSRNATSDKALGYTLGAEDYIVKPIDIGEFLPRVESKLRRISNQDQLPFIKGNFKVSLPRQKVHYLDKNGEVPLELTATEFKILVFFLQHEEHILSRGQILDHIWGSSTHITDRTVDTHIYTLRRKLKPFGNFIKSEKGTGYSFTHVKQS